MSTTRCRACDHHREQHRTLPIMRCLNPFCREFDRWKQIKRAGREAAVPTVAIGHDAG